MEWILYFASVSNKFSTLLIIFGIILGFIGVISFFCFVDTDEIKEKFDTFKHCVSFCILAILLIMIGILIPDKETIYAIGGINVLKNVINNSVELQELPDKSIKILNNWLDSIEFEDDESSSK